MVILAVHPGNFELPDTPFETFSIANWLRISSIPLSKIQDRKVSLRFMVEIDLV